jgi:hypothetical protein
MKKVLSSIGAVFGFTVLAAYAIFFAETGTFLNISVPRNSLSADVANVVAPAAPDAHTDAQAAVSAEANANVVADANSAAPAVNNDAPNSQASENPTIPNAVAPSTAVAIAKPKLVPTGAADRPATSTDSSATVVIATTSSTVSVPVPPTSAPQVSQPQTFSSSGTTLPYDKTNFADSAEWETIWGTLSTTQSGYMDLAAGSGSTGGTVYLKSSLGWADYIFSAELAWVGGQSFSLIGDYHDASNYVFCDYQRDASGTIEMQLKQYANGSEIALSPSLTVYPSINSAAPDNNSAPDVSASISVGGIYGTCSFGNQTVTNSGVGPERSAMSTPQSGGIGFSINDRVPNTASIIVKHLSAVSK